MEGKVWLLGPAGGVLYPVELLPLGVGNIVVVSEQRVMDLIDVRSALLAWKLLVHRSLIVGEPRTDQVWVVGDQRRFVSSHLCSRRVVVC